MGISRERVLQMNEREGWNSSGLIQGPLWQSGEPHTMHCCAIVTETTLSTTAMEIKEGKRKSHLQPPKSAEQMGR